MRQQLTAILPTNDLHAAEALFARLGFRPDSGYPDDYWMRSEGMGDGIHFVSAVRLRVRGAGTKPARPDLLACPRRIEVPGNGAPASGTKRKRHGSTGWYSLTMWIFAASVTLLPLPAKAQTLPAGAWDVTSTVVEFGVPGVPGFIRRIAKGRSEAEHKRLIAGEGVAALLAPDPKAHCRVADQHIAGGRYSQALICPQKRGEPLSIARSGTYDAIGFVGQATITGITPKGPINTVLDQKARQTG